MKFTFITHITLQRMRSAYHIGPSAINRRLKERVDWYSSDVHLGY